MSKMLAIYYFLQLENKKDVDKWFSVKELAHVMNLSRDWTRKYVNLLVHSGDVKTKVCGWVNVYKFKD